MCIGDDGGIISLGYEILFARRSRWQPYVLTAVPALNVAEHVARDHGKSAGREMARLIQRIYPACWIKSNVATKQTFASAAEKFRVEAIVNLLEHFC